MRSWRLGPHTRKRHETTGEKNDERMDRVGHSRQCPVLPEEACGQKSDNVKAKGDIVLTQKIYVESLGASSLDATPSAR